MSGAELDQKKGGECTSKAERREELIATLSALHINSSEDPEILCEAGIGEFNKKHPDFKKYPAMQEELRVIVKKHEAFWLLS